jgi:electron transport complex protein RnfE
LIVVNCIVLGRAEAFASKNGVLASALDGLFQGCGYTAALVIICVIRELLGNGTFGGGLLNGGEGIRIIPQDMAAMQLVMPVGGFLVLGCVIAGSQWLMRRMNDRKEDEK